MYSSIAVAIRTLVVLALLLVMPVLALPAVGRWFDSAMLGESAASKPENVAVRRPPDHAPLADPAKFPTLASSDDSTLANAADVADVSPVDRSEYIQQRLIQLGANYMRLERLDPPDEPAFRFHCQMAVAGSAAYHRPFEVTDPDPLLAMERVLAEVEIWHTARLESSSANNRVLR